MNFYGGRRRAPTRLAACSRETFGVFSFREGPKKLVCKWKSDAIHWILIWPLSTLQFSAMHGNIYYYGENLVWRAMKSLEGGNILDTAQRSLKVMFLLRQFGRITPAFLWKLYTILII